MAPHQQLLIRRALAAEFFFQPNWAHGCVKAQVQGAVNHVPGAID